ncbi:MAG: efflux RND transporter periplasmic adaptor subunit [Deltaproteobacteria bacterium]
MNAESPRPSPGRPLRFGTGTLILVALGSAALAVAAALSWSRPWGAATQAAQSADAEASLYQCPMHPSIVRDHPGECPICGMKLVRIDGGRAKATPQDSARRRVLFYRSPMDAKQTSPTPRKDEMGMEYLPVYEDEVGALGTVPGLVQVEIDADRQQLIGLTTAEVSQGPVGGAWRTVGRVAIDETRVRHINLKVPGFIERIYVDFIGKQVQEGDPLFSIYSPELLSAQEEYLLALQTKAALGRAGGVENDGAALVAAARRKLALWDVPKSEIERVERTGRPTKAVTFYSPVAGVVTRKDVVEGMKLDAGAMPYEIVDLSSVWVLADVYESELRFVQRDMLATLKLNAFPNREFKGKVVFIDPVLDPQTRTVKVRVTFANPTAELRPEMFGEVVLQGTPHDGLRIPPDAVIDSGTDKLVFVALGEGKFQPRKVEIGTSDGSHAEVISGLAAGERVVTRANFLVDSESRLRASLAEISVGAAVPQSARVLPGGSEPVQTKANAATAAPRDPPTPPEHRGH